MLDDTVKCYNRIPLLIGNSYKLKGEFWEYVGIFNNLKDVPQMRCCYVIGNTLYVKRKNISTFEKPKERRKRVDDSKPIDTSIKENDNPLMILTKVALKNKGITRGDLRNMFDNTSDMNNMLRQIEVGESLSWARFTEMLDKMNLRYDLTVYELTDGKKQTIVGD